MKKILLSGLLVLGTTQLSLADYQVKDAAGATITIKSRTNAGVQLPQSVPSSADGTPSGTPTNPTSVVLPSGQVVVLGAGTASIGSVVLGAGSASIGSVVLGAGSASVGTVQVGNFPATQPVSAAALPLPSGAATAARQSAPGVAGTPSADVLSVQGAAGGTALPVDTIVRSTSADRGGTITTGGTAQVLMASNPARRGFAIQNQSSTELFVNCTGTAAPGFTSLRVPAGGLYETGPHHSGTGACSIFGSTTAQAYYAREF